MLVIWISNYLDRLGPWFKFVENSTKLTCHEITSYRIKYRTVLWLLELQIRHSHKVQAQAHTVKSNSQISNCQCSLLSEKKNRLSGYSAYPDGSPTQLIQISVDLLYIAWQKIFKLQVQYSTKRKHEKLFSFKMRHVLQYVATHKDNIRDTVVSRIQMLFVTFLSITFAIRVQYTGSAQ